MVNYTVKDIPVKNLLLDVANPRHEISEGQTDALKTMLSDQKGKLPNLANDILEKGINPSDLTIVTPDKKADGKYIVLEGNRRLAAIQLMEKPVLADLSKDQKMKTIFKQFGQRYKINPTDTLSCVVFKKREDAAHWIERKHTGENDGVGVVAWTGRATARFKEGLGVPSPSLQIVDFVKTNASLDKVTKQKLSGVNLTNISRLVNDPDVRANLGISIKDGIINAHYSAGELITGLTKMVTDIATAAISVKDIYYKHDRAKYVEDNKFEELLQDAEEVIPWSLQSQKSPVTPTAQVDTTTKKKKSVPISTSRKTLIPSVCVLKIKHNRINKIYKELRDIPVDDYENACAVMLRVFLELSLDEYASSKNIILYEGTSLAQKIQLVGKYIKDNNLMTPTELKPVDVASGSKDALFSANTLNAYIHNPDFNPQPLYLKTTWNNMEKFMKAIWS